METGHSYLQIAINVMMILGASVVAFICDQRKRPLAQEALAAMERGARLAAVAPVPKPAAGKRDWNSLLAQRAIGKTGLTGIPAGYHDEYVLSQLVQRCQQVSGLVVSIGVSAPHQADGSLPEIIRNLIQSLIGPNDFACQSNEEEFLLVYPQERGSSAQRRLNQIAQQLWDFQHGSMGTPSIFFSWGGLEVRNESIDEAVASANDRMHETKRGRKLLMTVERPLRQAV